MLLSRIAETSTSVASTRSRNAKTERLAATIKDMTVDEVAIGVSYLSGRLPQGRLGVGFAAIRDVDALPAEEPSLTLADVNGILSDLQNTRGAGSRAKRAELLSNLMAAATPDEQALLFGLLGGGLRQGALDGVMADALAAAFDAPKASVRRAAMLSGNLAGVAEALASEGPGALDRFGLEVGVAVQPMLASTAESATAAVDTFDDAFVEWKVDGARLQIHRAGEDVAIYTRSLRPVTRNLKDIVEKVRSIDSTSFILDAEVISLKPDGTPEPFQVTMTRFAKKSAPDLPLDLFVFDALRLDGDLIDLPLRERVARIDAAVPGEFVIPRILTSDPAAAEAFAAEALETGHEGVMVKDADSLYSAGRRGSAWLKVKPAHTLDLVVLGVEWGSGRRSGFLSNIHLGARDGDEFVMLGKTFKGMTDEILKWQTERFQEIETHRDGHVVFVRPEQVVEIAFDGVQRSSRYPGGVALRFARVKGYRADKEAREADTLATVRSYLQT
ncbi:MAG: ATP-dependent DNA ligase [Acidimicrobiia bacterium]|nr:ATP-dependent DNA ligase [Acidimicrobiia bacterium]